MTWNMWIVLFLKTNSRFQVVEQKLSIYSNRRSKCHVFKDNHPIKQYPQEQSEREVGLHFRPDEFSI